MVFISRDKGNLKTQIIEMHCHFRQQLALGSAKDILIKNKEKVFYVQSAIALKI